MTIKLYSPFDMLINLINKKYPTVDVEIYFDDTLNSLGKTIIPDNYDTPEIYINANNSVVQSLDIIAHEVAHAITPNNGHGKAWQKIYDEINKMYLKEVQGE